MWSLLGLLWIHRRYEHKNIIHLFKFRFHSVYFKMQKISAPSHSSFFSFLSMMSCIYILSDPHRLSEPCLSELRQWNSQVNAGKIENLFPDGKTTSLGCSHNQYWVPDRTGRSLPRLWAPAEVEAPSSCQYPTAPGHQRAAAPEEPQPHKTLHKAKISMASQLLKNWFTLLCSALLPLKLLLFQSGSKYQNACTFHRTKGIPNYLTLDTN